MKDLATLTMESFVVIVDKHRDAQGLGQKEFGRKCWPESTPMAAAARWQVMRTKSRNTDKPQGILITDAYRMATVLGIDLPYLMMEAMYRTNDIASKSEEYKDVADKGKGKRKPKS